MKKPKVLVAMSGGVDSSVTAALLKQQGYEVVGCFMRLGSPGESLESDADACSTPASKGAKVGHQGCCSINDAKDAQLVAAMLDIPFYVLNFKRDFGRVMDYFVGEYNAGRTPNPCVRCNDWLKFGKLDDYARSIDAAFVATGHYARIENSSSGEPMLLRGVDRDKDQSYVLFGQSRDRLRRMMLPIGGYRKTEIRKLAQELGLPVFDKPDSQEICFVPDMDYARLVRQRTPEAFAPGLVVEESGKVLATHEGHQHFTIGQRRGLGISSDVPLYVLSKDAQSNTITVGPRERLAVKRGRANQVNWLMEPPAEAMRCEVKIRYNAQPVPAWLRAVGGDELEVEFDQPQFAVAPGQAMVCYEGDRVIAGGWLV